MFSVSHCPCLCQSHLGANDLSDLFDRYVSEAVRLKGAYRDQITLLVGAEVEYINDEHLQQTKATLEKHKDSLEYIVGSVHHCGEKWIDFDKAHFDECLDSYPGEDWDDKYNKLLEEYFDNQYNLIDKLRPQIIGHFDLCRLYYPNVSFRDRPNVWTKVERNVQLAISYGALFEVNAAAFRKGWSTAYPAPEIMDVRQFPFPGTV